MSSVSVTGIILNISDGKHWLNLSYVAVFLAAVARVSMDDMVGCMVNWNASWFMRAYTTMGICVYSMFKCSSVRLPSLR